MVKKRACVFISGTGTNLKFLIKNSRDYNFPIKIDLIITNKKDAKGIHYAKKFFIPFLILDARKNVFEKKVLKELSDRKIKLICLAGFMKILSVSFIRNFRGKIINIHPSLLPKFKGLNTFVRAIKAKEHVTGCTVHFVDEKLDNGKIIVKKRVSINRSDSAIELKKKVQLKEYMAYSEAIRKLYNKINF